MIKSEKTQTIRTFFAAELHYHAKQQIEDLILPLRQQWDMRWIPTVSLHITLSFLGDIPEAIVPSLTNYAQAAFLTSQRFNINFTTLEYFPDYRPKVIALLPDNKIFLAGLASKANEAAHLCQLSTETRPYRPHLSIARVKNPHSERLILPASVSLNNIEISSVSLFKSLGHSYYQSLANFQLS